MSLLLPTARRHDDARMQIKPVLARVPAAERWQVRYVNRVAPPTHRRTSARTECGDAMHGRGGQAGQRRRVLIVHVLRVRRDVEQAGDDLALLLVVADVRVGGDVRLRGRCLTGLLCPGPQPILKGT
jgi:hypothetical protein